MTRKKSSEKIFELENSYKYIAQLPQRGSYFFTYQALFIPLVNVSTILSIVGRFYIIFLAALHDEQNIMLLNPAQFEIFGERNYFHY